MDITRTLYLKQSCAGQTILQELKTQNKLKTIKWNPWGNKSSRGPLILKNGGVK